MPTNIVDNREEALKAGFEATDWHIPMTFDDYLQVTADWDVKAIAKQNQIIGAVYNKDGETHVAILPDWRRRWLSKSVLKDLLAKTTVTRVTPGHEYMYNVLGRLGFVLQPDGTLRREN